jgi:hypothetical protein
MKLALVQNATVREDVFRVGLFFEYSLPCANNANTGLA